MGDAGKEQRPIRCAIYTRKSTEEGLDQAFNSLDAQREACAAYILSQRHERWVAGSELYDDGGFSGGNMERPGLKQLMADIAAGKVNVIVVYKVDRLTRSLADFAKIVDVLDAAGASFVSITQSFNTTTSMGRLTLNVLLSFAQFEREVTGERIRDKIAASKKKGMWMGGPVPLGYDVLDRKLVVNDSEADTVRHIMRRYLAVGSVRALADELSRDNCVTKIQQRVSGPHRGGIAFQRGTLFHLLKNRIYRGEIVHKGSSYAGEHQAIVPTDLWNEVQLQLSKQAAQRRLGNGADHPSLLTGLVRDGLGRKMTPSHAVKGPKRYRYYITHSSTDAEPACRVSAHDLEQIVLDRLIGFLDNPGALDAATGGTLDAFALKTALSAARTTGAGLATASTSERNRLARAYIAGVRVLAERIEISIRLSAFIASAGDQHHVLSATAARVRCGHDVKLVVPAQQERLAKLDPKLVRRVAEAFAARQHVLARPSESVSVIAANLGRCRGELANQMRLSYLAPDIVVAILEERQPPSLNAKYLALANLPLDWREQRKLLGFA